MIGKSAVAHAKDALAQYKHARALRLIQYQARTKPEVLVQRTARAIGILLAEDHLPENHPALNIIAAFADMVGPKKTDFPILTDDQAERI